MNDDIIDGEFSLEDEEFEAEVNALVPVQDREIPNITEEQPLGYYRFLGEGEQRLG